MMGQLLMVPVTGGTCGTHGGEMPTDFLGGGLLSYKTIRRRPSGRFPPPMQILTYLDGVVKVEETELKPRVGFLYPIVTHNISVFINATRERDSGQYMCTVNVVDDVTSAGKTVGVINLTVLGKAWPRPPRRPSPASVTSSRG